MIFSTKFVSMCRMDMQFQPDRTMQEAVEDGVVAVGLPVCFKTE